MSHTSQDRVSIHLLPSELCNQIAAGEVVERPASVLKELVENSLDAGSTEIVVRLADGGQTLLSVRDNGHGIAADELKLAVTRHATSKVKTFKDLLHVSSYGFRGEALPSIASVAEMRLESSIGGTGAYIELSHGEMVGSGQAAIRKGTLVEVRNLFSNVPARLKFLKSPATEAKKCQDTLLKLALAREGVAFKLFLDAREAFSIQAEADLKLRLSKLWPPQVVDSLIPVAGEMHGISVSGFVGNPGQAQARPDRMLFYVNSRLVHDRILQKALREAYKGRLLGKEYPQGILFISIPPDEIDVNVHPAKTEIRFREERALFSAVLHAVRQALEASYSLSSGPSLIQAASPHDGSGNANDTGQPAERGGPPRPARPQGFWGSLDSPRIIGEANALERHLPFDEFEPPEQARPHKLLPDDFFTPRPGVADGLGGPATFRESCAPEYSPQGAAPGFTSKTPPDDDARPAPDDTSGQPHRGYPIHVGDLTCLGQYNSTYLLIQHGTNLILLDQHAAHEKVLFNRFSGEAFSGQSRLLIAPENIELHPSEYDSLLPHLDSLKRLGFTLDAPSPTLLHIHGYPPLVTLQKGRELLRQILDGKADSTDSILSLMACHAAIRAGQELTPDEVAGLLKQWAATPDREHCPHGRPVFITFQLAEIERLFKRRA